MQHSEGVGVFHPTSFWDCRPLAGPPLQVHRLGRQYMLEPAIIFC